jgi:uncharacterized protein YjiS (DUF1127 family)
MRDFALHESQFRAATHHFRWFRLVVKNLRRKSELLRLGHLTDHQLQDVGFSRDDLRYLDRLPLTSDLDWEKERLRLIASLRINSTGNK